MANVVFKINNVDFSDCIEEGGLKWQRNDLDADGSGRDLSGLMNRDRVATKIRLDVTTIPLKTARLSQLLQAIYPKSVQVTYTDPQAGTTLTKKMYSNSNPATCERQYGDTQLWDSISFPLIEY